jgi:hypothetical protein
MFARLGVLTLASEIVSVSISHPATMRHRGYVLTGYLAFCAVRGGLQLLAVWFYGDVLPRAGGIGGVGPIGLSLAVAGGMNALGALALWQWSSGGAVMLGIAAVATIAVGVQAGWAMSTALGIAMLAAAVITGFAAPWRLTCLRCRGVVTVRDAVCPSCGQAFLD